ncbi:hypothetical protein [Streptomyces sp. NPDC000880]
MRDGPAIPRRTARARCLTDLGRSYAQAGAPARGIGLLAEAVVEWRRAQDQVQLIGALRSLRDAQRDAGDHRDAVRTAELVDEESHPGGSEASGMAHAQDLLNLAHMYALTGRYASARRRVTEGMALCRSAADDDPGERQSLAWGLLLQARTLGLCGRRGGLRDISAALPVAREALEPYTRLSRSAPELVRTRPRGGRHLRPAADPPRPGWPRPA